MAETASLVRRTTSWHPGLTRSLSPIATVHTHGLSVSLGYVSGRLVIEISGLESEDAEPEPGAGLSLVTLPGPPSSTAGGHDPADTGDRCRHPLRRARLAVA